ncbi:putative Methyl-accepting chemotaxis sensory transducer [uncultured delta proteobacterium]|uniref:Putative Methyl-accepting chemotaxis sensory transducer n=1 Tax=uncultured delta proteobacterium TaxID=34034 RepID=A0A212IWP3_9DELT|nr:putative Methyl-accepting chemotaxis sensory transducer [uncultured delta proteobacterium]
MTTKRKIILGFFVTLVLLGVTAFWGYTGLQTASNNLEIYRGYAAIDVDASDLQSAVYESVYYAELYMKSKDPANIKEAQARVDKGFTIIGRALQTAKREDTIRNMTKAREFLTVMRNELGDLRKGVETVNAVFTRACLPYMEKTDKNLADLAAFAREISRPEALYYVTLVLQNLASVRESLAAFLITMNADEAKEILAKLESSRKSIERLGESLATDVGRKLHAEATANFNEVVAGFGVLMKEGAAVQEDIQDLAVRAGEALEFVAATNATADKLMHQSEEASLQGNARAQLQMLIIGAAGVLLGVAFAVFTILSLVRTLNVMSRFASDIAAGNFNSTATVSEKGEIGAMFAALRRIPEIFSGVITRCNDIADDIASGLFRDRLNLEHFQGGFRDLGQGINAIADAYTHSIDTLPVAIVTLDTQLRTRFSNTLGRDMLGPDVMKAFGGKMPLVEASLRENNHKAGETSIVTPEGKTVFVSAMSLPLRNMGGEVVGALEVLTDISEIKAKQNIMLEVANQASAISDRVAAASEQLAAQVEQVSRGAEVQRERVETTASAMTQMNSTVAEVARSASEASAQGTETREQAQSGASVVNRVVDSINEVSTIAVHLQENMETLGRQADSIGGVMNVISDIADQTNLLALNAAIEAARAGEAGRGFAVVADEVRKLAEKTMNATKEVGDNIAAMQQSANSNIAEVGVVAKNAAAAAALANESGAALDGILNLASATSHVVDSIATAAEEQSAASEEITQAIAEINRLVTETTDGMVQSSEAVQDLSRTAQELRRVMEGLQ